MSEWQNIYPGVRIKMEKGVVEVEVFDVGDIQVSPVDEIHDSEFAPEHGKAFAVRSMIARAKSGVHVGISFYTVIEPKPSGFAGMSEEQVEALSGEEIMERISVRQKYVALPHPELDMNESDFDYESDIAIAKGTPLPSMSEVASKIVALAAGEMTEQQAIAKPPATKLM